MARICYEAAMIDDDYIAADWYASLYEVFGNEQCSAEHAQAFVMSHKLASLELH